MTAYKSLIDANSNTFAANHAAMSEVVDHFRAVLAKIEEGGSEKSTGEESAREKGGSEEGTC